MDPPSPAVLQGGPKHRTQGYGEVKKVYCRRDEMDRMNGWRQQKSEGEGREQVRGLTDKRASR